MAHSPCVVIRPGIEFQPTANVKISNVLQTGCVNIDGVLPFVARQNILLFSNTLLGGFHVIDRSI